MRTEPRTFYSDGLKLSGAYFLPEEEGEGAPRPLVIPCSGFTGLMAIHPARFARSLTAAGFPCFAFDYRGFASSEGERGRVLLGEQVRDIRHAAAFAAEDARFDAERIVLLGWGMGAGLVLDAARKLPGVRGIIAANGFYDGKRVQQAHRGEDGLRAFEGEVDRERAARSASGEARFVDPFHLYPLDPASRAYVEGTLRTFDDYEDESYSFELGESLLRWKPEELLGDLTAPLLVAHGDGNRLHPTSEADALFERYPGPKELFWIEGAGHTEFMHDEDPRYQSLAARVVEFVRRIAA